MDRLWDILISANRMAALPAWEAIEKILGFAKTERIKRTQASRFMDFGLAAIVHHQQPWADGPRYDLETMTCDQCREMLIALIPSWIDPQEVSQILDG